MISPFQNYVRCCQKRMHLWISDDVVVEEIEPNQIQIRLEARIVKLFFHPETCRWSLIMGEDRATGTFDRLTKEVRRFLTTSLP